jgi:2-iminobutanoate/2-iminopropanoate deaminase
MAAHEMLTSPNAPKAIGPYSPAVRVMKPGAMLFVSGQIPIEPATGTVFLGAIERQAEIALSNLRAVVTDAGFGVDDITRCTVYLTDMKNFEAVNAVYARVLVGQTLPARAVVAVAGLPRGVGIEVDCFAVKQG